MDRLIQEIRAALAANMFVIALQSSLALIDICAALESANGRTRRSLFEAWFERHLSPRYPNLSAQDAYELRCGLLHQGRLSSRNYSSIVFFLPGTPALFSNGIVDDAFVHDLTLFVEDVLTAVSQWWALHGTSPLVSANSEHIVQIRPGGLPPYVVGMPVLA